MKRIVLFYTTLISLLLGTSLLSVPTHAFGANVTKDINVIAHTSEDTINLKYAITQEFNEESKGIFLALPKNQDGVWTEYKVISVTKERFDMQMPPKEESYSLIKEWDQLRLRMGEEDVILEKGVYQYIIEIEADFHPDKDYSFIVLDDWQDTLEYVEIDIDGKRICDSVANACDAMTYSFEVNPEGGQPALWRRVFYSSWPFFIVISLLSILTYIAWYYLARDPIKIDKKRLSPLFEPPADQLPWESKYFAQDGKISLKEALLSYILYLNHKKYISIKPKTIERKILKNKQDIELEILKDLPNLLPDAFNKAVRKIAELGVKDGILKSKINQQKDGKKLHDHLSKTFKDYYHRRPLSWSQVTGGILLIAFMLLFALIFIINGLQDWFLMGNSFIPLIFTGYGVCVLGSGLVMVLWDQPNRKGAAMKKQALRYRLYIEKAEKLKLDFSNNPTDGVQYYLKAVPYAAAFGLLAQFNSYFAKLLPQNTDIDVNSTLLKSYGAAHFYTPPSSSSSGSSFGGGGGFSGGGGSW